MKAQFHIYGLPFEVRAEHPRLLELFTEDLRTFRVNSPGPTRHTVRLTLHSLPLPVDGAPYPTRFAPYREMGSQRSGADATVIRYGRSLITVICSRQTRRIQAGVVIDPSVLPDPAYHHCFTLPVSPWFKRRGLFFLHAGCVADQGRAILIAGPSRAGKSTLSASAVRAGFTYLSDEQPLLSLHHGRLQAHAFPRRIRLDRPVAAIFPELRSLLASSASEQLIFAPERIWPNCGASSCPPRLLVFPHFHRTGRLRVTRLSPTATLTRLLQDEYFIWYRNAPWSGLSHQHLTLFEHLARRLPAFRLDYGPNEILRIPAVFRRLLRG